MSPVGVRTAGVWVLCTGLALAWRPEGFLGLGVLSATAVLLYAVVVGPVAFHGPLEAYVRPRWDAVLARLPVRRGPRADSKPTGGP